MKYSGKKNNIMPLNRNYYNLCRPSVLIVKKLNNSASHPVGWTFPFSDSLTFSTNAVSDEWSNLPHLFSFHLSIKSCENAHDRKEVVRWWSTLEMIHALTLPFASGSYNSNDGQRDTTRQSWLRNRQLPSESKPTKNAQDNGKKLFLLLFLNLLFYFSYFLKETFGSLVITSAHSRRRPSTYTARLEKSFVTSYQCYTRDKRARHYKKKEKRSIITTQLRSTNRHIHLSAIQKWNHFTQYDVVFQF